VKGARGQFLLGLSAYLKTGMRAASPDEQEVQDGEGEEAA
jgi:hypothetical protein